MRSALKGILVASLALAVFGLGGCSNNEAKSAIEPLVEPPVIGEAGVLRAGVDFDYPPFAGEDKGREAGIDIDLASALASELGLELETVQVSPSDVATAFAEGEVDIVMSVSFSEDAVLNSTLVGSYIDNAPAFFSASEETASAEVNSEETASAEAGSAKVEPVTLESIAEYTVAVQEGSAAYWLLTRESVGAGVVSFPTLREAFQAVVDGEADVVAGDAIVGAYIQRDFEGIHFAGQAAPAVPLGVAVAQDATELADLMRQTLDTLAANGVLDAIRSTWVGDLPVLETLTEDANSGE